MVRAIVASVLLAASCSKTVSVRVKDGRSGLPLQGVRVERYAPVSRLSKLVNPVGSFYHPCKLAESGITDSGGEVVFQACTLKDVYRIRSVTQQTLTVAVQDHQLQIAPSTNQVRESHWVYSVWYEEGRLGHLVEAESTENEPQ